MKTGITEKKKLKHKIYCTRGIQANKEYYIANIPFNKLSKLIKLEYDSNDKLTADKKYQRKINPIRPKKIANYILKNRNSYVFPALTATIDGNIEFTLVSEDKNAYNLGYIEFETDSKIRLNDGQHRVKGIIEALKMDKTLEYETIAIQFHIDLGIKENQQMFSDINKNAVKPSSSLNILYDNREVDGNLIKEIIPKIPLFSGRVEYEKTSLSKFTECIITLNQLYNASKAVVLKSKENYDGKKKLLIKFWNCIAENVKNYQEIIETKETTARNRKLTISGHAITFISLGQVGGHIIDKENWEEVLISLKDIDFSRTNEEWEGIALKHEKIMGTKACIDATTDYLLNKLGVEKESKPIDAELIELIKYIDKQFKNNKYASIPLAFMHKRWLLPKKENNIQFRLTINNLTNKDDADYEDFKKLKPCDIESQLKLLMLKGV
jgi:DNA sulfur modification protein DndB